MRTPESWSEEIYKCCHSPVIGRASVNPEFVRRIQADANQELIDALEWALAKEPSPCRCMNFALCVAHKALAAAMANDKLTDSHP
jgi:hypothetical protein